ncbi:unnamed protein product [Staurois parvus]|uniref:Uncharacterized protein n=1 Tax=Staurois parvus TaxID=386267 RepID=A0ABN9B8D6_9NEOB|nr:unnamed protein product [Staurois parvus]
MLFDLVFFDPPLLPVLPLVFPDKISCGVTLHMLSLVCIAREVFFFFFSWESACNQHCPDRGQGFCILLEQKNYKL